MDNFLRPNRRPKIDLESPPSLEVKEAVLEPPVPIVAEAEAANEYDDPNTSEPDSGEPEGNGAKKPGKPKKKFTWRVPTPKTKKQWIIAGAIMALLVGGAGFAVYWFIIRDTQPVVMQQPEPEPEPAPEPIYSRLSGREITNADINKRPVYAVQIENSPEARPQSGLKEADMVFEAVAEGGITRFNALFHDNIPANIGPVRSLRPYFIDFFLPFDAAIVHAGGSAEALQDVRNLGLKDMDSVSSIMRRISQRYSPHNYYTTGQQVLDLAVQRGYTSTFAGLPRKQPANGTEQDTETTPETESATPAGTINVRISSSLYNVRYVYDKAADVYLREQGGAKHVDAESGTQLAPNVVVVPIMGKRIHPDRVHTQYTTTGSGKLYVFQNGEVIEGTWSKASRSAQWVLKDASGANIELGPGQTWFTITDAAGNVTFAP